MKSSIFSDRQIAIWKADLERRYSKPLSPLLTGVDRARGPDQSDHRVLRMQQGHRYRFMGADVIALESGEEGRVAEVVAGQPWLGQRFCVEASMLEPLPMRYFHGQVPAN